MNTSDSTTDLIASIAELWEERPEYLPRVTEQVKAIHDKLLEWGWGTVDKNELDHATIMYSHACSVLECVGWLPFDVMPNWEDHLYCLLMDEDRWKTCIETNGHISDLAKIIRREVS